MDWLSKISPYGDFNLNDVTYGADVSSPLPDVSWSSPDMESSTPTGTGSGQFIDTATQNALLGGLDKVLNWAIQRDTAKIQQDTAYQLAGTQYAGTNNALNYQAQQSAANRKLIVIGLAVAGLFLVMRK